METEEQPFNKWATDMLIDMKQLEDNWDEDDALAPNPECLQLAKDVVAEMTKIKQEVYHVYPGPNGEVMLDFRKGDKKMLCLTFHPRRRIFATIFRVYGVDNYEFINGKFTIKKLSKLLDWLNK